MIIDKFRDLNVLVIGDVILDVYRFGNSTRACPEDPSAPVLMDMTTREYLGGAGNVAANCASLGANSVKLLGIRGNDEEGRKLNVLNCGSGNLERRLTVSDYTSTTVKERFLSKDKLICRVDRSSGKPAEADAMDLAVGLGLAWVSCDVIFVADYRLGVMSDLTIRQIEALQISDPKTVIVDAKDLAKYKGCKPTAACPNFRQFQDLIGYPQYPNQLDRKQWIEGCADLALNRSNASIMAVTLDSEGVMTLDRSFRCAFVEARPIEKPHRSGAGDTFTAAFGLCLASDASRYEAAEIAQRAAECAVRTRGTYAVKADELKYECRKKPASDPDRPKLVMASGCFDILHPGHVALLEHARNLGDQLIVAINSDESVARLKGPGRPINDQIHREKMLRGLKCVDTVCTFSGDDPRDVIAHFKPDVFVKGTDYSDVDLIEAETVKAHGGRVVLIPYQSGYSSTSIIERARSNAETPELPKAFEDRHASK